MKIFFLPFFLFFSFFPSFSFAQSAGTACEQCLDSGYRSLDGQRDPSFYGSDSEAASAAYAAGGGSCNHYTSTLWPECGVFFRCYKNVDFSIPHIDYYIHCDGICEEEEQAAIAACGSQSNINWTDYSTCAYECADDDDGDCPDSDDDGLPDCCGDNLDCPDSDGDGIYDCCGDGGECEDSDGDGTPDACDACPDDPAISEKEICSYEVDSYCDGVSDYQVGAVCGTYTTSCGDDDGCKSNGDQYYEESGSECGFTCCEEVGCETVRCDVDPETCEPRTCDCPEGQETCAECKDPDCSCDDGSDTCAECQLPNEDDSGGDPASDGCECPDGEDVCSQCQDPDCTCDDGSTEPCAECQYPPPSVPPGGGGGSDLLPDEIQVGDCIIDLTDIKEYLSSPDSFPFNYFSSLLGVFSPLISDGSPPIIDLTIPLDSASSYSYIPDKLGGIVDFSEYSFLSSVVSVIRFVLDLVLLLSLVSYFIARYHNFHGISR
ncbi:MAG: hypothetical protein Q3M24_16450 [Candidatus Electrothrix aestuarii]|uniref:Thrombospondin type 3 repeat-containing protein n=1 Tax=Candidatus Electrothrix aestuarii TaxID=3062594 RepID=A0AAU8LQT9_9BACT|nr:hypothetical protein [Candidatus Electrothrix aestuarii]